VHDYQKEVFVQDGHCSSGSVKATNSSRLFYQKTSNTCQMLDVDSKKAYRVQSTYFRPFLGGAHFFEV
jgi:hypothetical protein